MKLSIVVAFATAVMSASLLAVTSARMAGVSETAVSFAQTVADKSDLTKGGLKKLVENTTWGLKRNGKETRYSFYRDGRVISNGPVGYGNFYTVEAHGILKIYGIDPSKRDADFWLFHVNAATMTAEYDDAASTAKGGNTLAYIGPAPPEPKK